MLPRWAIRAGAKYNASRNRNPRLKPTAWGWLRRCTACDEWKPVESFNLSNHKGAVPGATRSKCRPCVRQYGSAWWRRNAKRVNERRRKRRAATVREGRGE